MNVKANVRWALLSALTAILLTSSVVLAQTFPKSLTGWVIAQRLTVNTISTLTGDVTMGDDLLISGGIDGFVTNNLAATVTITNNGTLTPLGTVQRLTAVAAVGTSGANIVVQPAGTILVLLNSGSNTITFTETGTLVSAGNIALGANDSATLVSNGTNWYQTAASNN